jgi:hypothetical protein
MGETNSPTVAHVGYKKYENVTTVGYDDINE